MKFLKGLLVSLLCIVLSFSLFALTLSIAVKDMIQNQLLESAVKSAIEKNVEDSEEKETITEYVDKLTSYGEINEIIDSILKDYVDYSKNGKDVSDETIDMIISFCLNHKDDIQLFSESEIDTSEIDTPESRENLRKTINEGFKDIDREDIPVSDIVTVYSYSTRKSSWVFISIIIVILIALIALVTWSTYKWLKPVGATFISTGVTILILYGIITYIINAILNNSEFNINFNSNVLLISGIIEFVLGLVFAILHSVIKKNENNVITEQPVVTNQVETMPEEQKTIE